MKYSKQMGSDESRSEKDSTVHMMGGSEEGEKSGGYGMQGEE